VIRWLKMVGLHQGTRLVIRWLKMMGLHQETRLVIRWLKMMGLHQGTRLVIRWLKMMGLHQGTRLVIRRLKMMHRVAVAAGLAGAAHSCGLWARVHDRWIHADFRCSSVHSQPDSCAYTLKP